MKYLLDVNALIAFAFQHHQFHNRVTAWIRAERVPSLLSCSITELGFVRILAQTPGYQLSIAQARNLLIELKRNRVVPLGFVAPQDHILQGSPTISGCARPVSFPNSFRQNEEAGSTE
jgi:predicted nucleic acid-binding protein